MSYCKEKKGVAGKVDREGVVWSISYEGEDK